MKSKILKFIFVLSFIPYIYIMLDIIFSGYVLNGTKCTKTVNSTDTKNATANYKTSCKKEYKWSTSSSLPGWTFTGEKKLLTKYIIKEAY